MYQTLAWQLSLILITILFSGFLFVIFRSQEREEDTAQLMSRAYKIRTLLFYLVLMLATPIMLYSLINLPYATASIIDEQAEAQVIDAVGHQWYWSLSQNQVLAGTPVKFRVTSADVNHGFGIYNQDMQLVAQTMAMPNYTNTLHYTFNQPGTYQILCLEYCGLVHHNMIAKIQVAARPEAGE